jgi:hypothetical protein
MYVCNSNYSAIQQDVSSAREVREEMEVALAEWKQSGRFEPIVAEMKSISA